MARKCNIGGIVLSRQIQREHNKCQHINVCIVFEALASWLMAEIVMLKASSLTQRVLAPRAAALARRIKSMKYFAK